MFISDLFKIPMILDFDLDVKGRFIIYSSNASGLLQLYLFSLINHTEPVQLTTGSDPVYAGHVAPDGSGIAYMQDKNGNESHHLFLLSLADKKSVKLSKEAYRTFSLDWDPNGIEITRTFASKASCGLQTFNLKTGESFILKADVPPLLNVKYSHDGKWIACTMYKSSKNQEILVINRKDPDDYFVYTLAEDSKETNPIWSPDDSKLAFISDVNGRNQVVVQEFQGSEKVFLELNKDEEVFPGHDVVWHPNGDQIYYCLNKYGRTKLVAHSLTDNARISLPFPLGTVSSPKIVGDGRFIMAIHSSMVTPPAIYMHTFNENSIVKILSQECKFDLSKLMKPKSIWYESFDKRKIHGWYIPAVESKSKCPAVVSVHGGPWSQVSDEWFNGVMFHIYSQNGFAVFAPNFRGSTGYGAEFQNLDLGDPGGGDLEDIVKAAEWLSMRPEIDKSKIGITGISYGGYMTLMALTKKPEVFAVGVSLVPVVDWMEMYYLSDLAYRAFVEMLLAGKPSENEALYKDRSPITHVKNIRAPVMIMAGKNDSRCPIQPIEKFVEKLKDLNHPHEFIVEEKAGHISSLFKWEEAIPLFTKIIAYFKKNLG